MDQYENLSARRAGVMAERFPRIARVWATWLPMAGVGIFIALYLYAASLYPGGTSLDHQIRGYSHMSNYWCDLLDEVSYSGDINRGRPFAMLATIILPLSLVPLWLQVPLLFHGGSLSRRIVRVAGPASMVLSTLVFTSMHDLVINLASIIGFVAFVVTVLSLAIKGCTALVCIALFPISLGLANYVMWQTGSLLWAMPLVQKVAYSSFFLWIAAVSHAILHTLTADTELEADHNPSTEGRRR